MSFFWSLKRVAVFLSLLTQAGLGLADEWTERPLPLKPVVQRSDEDEEKLRAAALVMEARILERRDELATALRKYQRAWRLDEEAHVLLKQIVPLALHLGRVEEATRYALLLTKSDLEDPFLAERLAMLMADQLEYDRSLQLYQHVLQLRVNEPETRDPIGLHFEMGRLYFLTDKHEQAAQSFHVVLDALEDPARHKLSDEVRDAILSDPALAWNLFAESFLEAGDYEGARKMFRRTGEAKETDDGWLEFQLARVDYRAGKYADARRRLETYVAQKLKLGGRTPYELLQSVMEKATTPTSADKQLEESADQPHIIARFRDWLSDDPDNFPLLSYVADLTRNKGTLKDAAELYERSIAAQPTVESFEKLIDTYRHMEDHEKLLETLSRITSEVQTLEPFADSVAKVVEDNELLAELLNHGRLQTKSVRDDSVAITCGLLAIDAGQLDVAAQFLDRVERDPQWLDVFVNWGLACLGDDQPEDAVRIFSEAIESPLAESNEGVLHYYLAGALETAGRHEAALQAAEKAAKRSGDIPDVQLRPAWIRYRAGDIERAAADYSAWIEKYAEDYSQPALRESVREARFVMSDICLERKQIDEAIEWLEQVLDEYPGDIGAGNDLGYLLVDQNRSLHRASKMILRAVAADPDNVAYRDSLGWCYFRQGKFAQAVTELRKAASQEAPDPIILDHLAEALWADGKRAEAVTHWERALSGLATVSAEQSLHDAIAQKIAKFKGE